MYWSSHVSRRFYSDTEVKNYKDKKKLQRLNSNADKP